MNTDVNNLQQKIDELNKEIERLRYQLERWQATYKELLSNYGKLAMSKNGDEPKLEPTESFIRNEMYPPNRYSGD
jgi:TolA-binding protein